MGPHLVVCALIMRRRVVRMTSNVDGQIVYPSQALSDSSVSDCRIKCGRLEFVDLPTQFFG